MELQEELESLSTEDLQIINNGLSGKQVDPAQFSEAANKLSTQSLAQLDKELQSAVPVEDEKQFIQDLMEAQTLTGQLKQAGRTALQGAVEVGEFVDKFTGAPTRSAIAAAQEGDFLGAPGAFVKQFGEDPSLAPTGKEIATKTGLSTEETIGLPLIGKVSPAGIAGLGVDILADPTNIIPFKAAQKLVGAGLSKTAKASLDLAKKGIHKGSKAALSAVRAKSRLADEAVEALSLKFKPQQAPDFKELVDIAQKNGINPEVLPEAIEFGADSVITRSIRKKGEGVLGEPILSRHDNAIKEVNQAMMNGLEKISGGRILTPDEAGLAIRKGFGDSVEKFFNEIDHTYKSIGDQVGPGFRLDPSSKRKLTRKLNERLKSIADDFNSIDPDIQRRARVTQDAIEKLKAADGDYNTIVRRLQDIGRVGFNRKTIIGETPIDIKAIRELYHEVQEPIMDTIRKQLGEDVAADLIVNNFAIKDFLSDKNIVSKIVLSDLAPEKVFQNLIANGDTKQVDALNNMLSPEILSQLKGTFFDSLIKRDIEGKFTFRSLFNQLRNKKQVAERLFEPEELNNFLDLTRLGDRLGSPILSSSGTGAANSFSNIPDAINKGLTNDVIIDALKRMARGPEALAKEKAILKGISDAPNISFRRGPIERALKATQVGSVQEKNPDTPLNNALRR